MTMLRKLAVTLILFTACAYAQAAAGFTKINTSTITGVTFTDAGCQNQTTCYYQVTAVDSTGHESPAALCDATALCFSLNQVVAVMPSSGTHSVVLTWIASTSSVVSGYNCYRAIGPLPPTTLKAVVN